jgi:hypothetical protein
MKTHTFYIITLIAGMLFASACEKNVEIDIDETDPMIVLNSVLKADSSVVVFLSRTRHVLDNKDITPISGAEVILQDENGNKVTLDYSGNGSYTTDEIAVLPGTEYTVSASAKGFNPVTASCMVPRPVEIMRMDTSSLYTEWGDREITMDLIFSDPPDEVNYYTISATARVAVLYREIRERFDTLYETPDTVVTGFVLDTIDTYVNRYEPVYIESEDLAVEEYDFDGGVIFSDKIFNGKQYSFNMKLYTWSFYEAADTSAIYINLQAIDENYFRYIDTREKHYYAREDPFAVPVVVHNNIENGVGILGGMTISADSISIPPSPYPMEHYYY